MMLFPGLLLWVCLAFFFLREFLLERFLIPVRHPILRQSVKFNQCTFLGVVEPSDRLSLWQFAFHSCQLFSWHERDPRRADFHAS